MTRETLTYCLISAIHSFKWKKNWNHELRQIENSTVLYLLQNTLMAWVALIAVTTIGLVIQPHRHQKPPTMLDSKKRLAMQMIRNISSKKIAIANKVLVDHLLYLFNMHDVEMFSL